MYVTHFKILKHGLAELLSHSESPGQSMSVLCFIPLPVLGVPGFYYFNFSYFNMVGDSVSSSGFILYLVLMGIHLSPSLLFMDCTFTVTSRNLFHLHS